ncbi:MAG: LacI family DNA-binding transcriptional regulator [Anaerolineae bacterium]|nr:LacI family DNA-binding transcriptional regulator [Anaerolineae bacterium]
MSTIHEVAARANVSIKTVSRVINGESGVAEPTRQRVLTAIHELDYVPNLSAQRLKRGRSELLALVLPRVESPYAIKLFADILAQARKHQYSVLVFEHCLDQPRQHKAIERGVRNHRVDGVIIAPPGGDNPDLVNFLRAVQIPYVVISPNRLQDHACSIQITEYLGACEATRYLISLGHRRIAHITCLQSERFGRERLAGYLDTLSENGLPAPATLVSEGDNSVESGYRAANVLLSQPEPPTAIFAGNDEMAVGAILAAYQLGIHIPDNLSVIGFDDSAISLQIFPHLTTVVQPIGEIARASVECLLEAIEDPNAYEDHRLIPTHLELRNSCAIPKDRRPGRP